MKKVAAGWFTSRWLDISTFRGIRDRRIGWTIRWTVSWRVARPLAITCDKLVCRIVIGISQPIMLILAMLVFVCITLRRGVASVFGVLFGLRIVVLSSLEVLATTKT